MRRCLRHAAPLAYWSLGSALKWHTAHALAAGPGFADGSDAEKAVDRCGLTG